MHCRHAFVDVYEGQSPNLDNDKQWWEGKGKKESNIINIVRLTKAQS